MLKTAGLDLIAAANEALDFVEPSIVRALQKLEGRVAFHMVVMDHRVSYSPDLTLPIIAERTFGETDESKWNPKYPYIQLARKKARLCWRTGRSCRDVIRNSPWLLLAGDTKYPGGIIFNDLIIAGSGFPWPFDEAFSYSAAQFMWANFEVKMQRIMQDDGIVTLE